MGPIKFDGMVFGPKEVEENRKMLIALRDAALKAENFDFAVALSHTIAILAAVVKDMSD